MATRMLMTLDDLDHTKWSYLDGGMTAWMAELRPMGQTEPVVARG